MGIGWQEILIVAFIVLLLFGGRKLPELMRGLGKGIREFSSAKSSIKSEIEEGGRTEENLFSLTSVDSYPEALEKVKRVVAQLWIRRR